MDSITGLTITVKVDTAEARREVMDFQRYALRVLEEVRAAYASLEPPGGPEFLSGLPKPGRRV